MLSNKTIKETVERLEKKGEAQFLDIEEGIEVLVSKIEGGYTVKQWSLKATSFNDLNKPESEDMCAGTALEAVQFYSIPKTVDQYLDKKISSDEKAEPTPAKNPTL